MSIQQPKNPPLANPEATPFDPVEYICSEKEIGYAPNGKYLEFSDEEGLEYMKARTKAKLSKGEAVS